MCGGGPSIAAPAPTTSANQQKAAVDTQAQIKANEQQAARKRRSTSLYGTAGGAQGAADAGTSLAAGKTTLGQ